MCGRYNLDFSDPREFTNRFKIANVLPKDQLRTSYNIAPGQKQPVIMTHSPNIVEIMLWELVPFWEKSDKPKGLINLRDDTILTKKWAHKYIQFQRCLIPASGFFNRMPVILKEKDENSWLNPDMVEIENIKEFLQPYPSREMEKVEILYARAH